MDIEYNVISSIMALGYFWPKVHGHSTYFEVAICRRYGMIRCDMNITQRERKITEKELKEGQ